MTEETDVLVVGAGPAGCSTARILARLGARVALVDGSHPREKPCGGGVTGRALALVAGAIDPGAVPRCQIRAARFVDAARGASTRVPLGGGDLVVASRTEFDGALLAAAVKAGVRVVRSRVNGITRDSSRFAVQTQGGRLRARVLVGADGANSLVRRLVARPFARADLSIATGYVVHGTTSDEILIEFVADPPGYIWSFPRPTHLAVGICAQADSGVRVDSLRARTLHWIRTMKLDRGALEPYSWPIPSLSPASLAALATSGPGWYLAGDAAGLVDPITREGIYFALLSGEWAAHAIASSDDSAARRAYHERVHDEIVAELIRAARYKTGFFQPRFARLLFEALAESEGIRHVMAGLVAGTQPYATLKRALLGTAELGLAWRLVRAKWYN